MTRSRSYDAGGAIEACESDAMTNNVPDYFENAAIAFGLLCCLAVPMAYWWLGMKRQ